MQFQDLVRGDPSRDPELGDVEPLAGSLPENTLRALVGLLGRWADSGELCWFGMWDGNGSWWKGAHSVLAADGRDDPRLDRIDDERDRVLRETPTFGASQRQYFLMRGPLGCVGALWGAAGSQSPALWWPTTRRWLVSTEVDAYGTYVGGPADLIAELAASSEIEALATRLDAPLDWGI